MRVCKTCRVAREVSEFYRRARGGVLNTNCAVCARAVAAAYRVAGPKKVAATMDKWRRANLPKVREMKRRNRAAKRASALVKEAARCARFNAAHPGANNKICADWKKQNAARVNAYCAERKARKLSATPAWANKFFIAEAYELAQRRTRLSGFQWDVDHLVPLKSRDVCGLHTEQNLQVIPALDNARKRNAFWPDMWGSAHG